MPLRLAECVDNNTERDHLHAGPGAPTVLVYGHHDVQPIDPLEEWTSRPFEPVVVDGELRARGAIDDKGRLLFQIEAARGLLARGGALAVNVKFLLGVEEEVGCPNLYLGMALPDDRFHAAGELLHELGELHV